MIKTVFASLTLIAGLSLPYSVSAAPQAESQPAENAVPLKNHTLYYTLFNSTFVPEQVASIYGLKRSDYEWLLNIIVSKPEEYGGIPVTLAGHATNLIGQQQTLNFKTIDEGNTVYYLASVRVNGEEHLNFDITVKTPDGESQTVKFKDKVISD